MTHTRLFARLLIASIALSTAWGLPHETVRSQTPPPALGVPNTNPVPPTGSPIQVETCRLQYNGNLLVAKTGKLEIAFTNEGNVTADLVRFGVSWGDGNVAYLRDVGKFSPGITITHTFRQSEGELVSPLFSHPDLRCFVASVHFVDGSVWTVPQ